MAVKIKPIAKSV